MFAEVSTHQGEADEIDVTKQYTISTSALINIKTTNTIKNRYTENYEIDESAGHTTRYREM